MDLHVGQAVFETERVIAFTLGFAFSVARETADMEYFVKSA
jgi:hypothetical protein